MQNNPNFPSLLERFFTQRLMAQRQASPHTIASYRDTFRLLLEFAQKKLHTAPSKLALTDLDAPLIGSFLDELESAAATLRAAATCVSRQSTPSFTMPPLRNLLSLP